MVEGGQANVFALAWWGLIEVGCIEEAEVGVAGGVRVGWAVEKGDAVALLVEGARVGEQVGGSLRGHVSYWGVCVKSVSAGRWLVAG